MIVNKSYKYRIHPTKEQVKRFQWILGKCCDLYNAALQERRESWKCAHKFTSLAVQMRELTEIRDKICPEYQQIRRAILNEVLIRLDKAFQAFFRRIERGEKAGYPRFRIKNRYDSFTYPDVKGLKIVQSGGRLSIVKLSKLFGVGVSKLNIIKVRMHRPVEGQIKTVTIKRENEHWYIVFSCEVEQEDAGHYSEEAVGIDLGLRYLATLSTGETIKNPRFLHKADSRLKRLRQSLKKKKRGSNRREKVVRALLKVHRKVRNQRTDFLNKASLLLIKRYKVVVFEKLDIRGLLHQTKAQQRRNGTYSFTGKLNKSIRDVAWGRFVRMCVYKAEEAGGRVVQVDPKYTSQLCSNCGAIVKKDLSERWHSCTCGCELDRDHNAAINILRLGLATL